MEGQTSCTTASVENGTHQSQTSPPPPRTTNTTTRSSLYSAPSRTVRTNWIYYLQASWRRISRTSKVILGTTLLIGLAQIVITIVMLIIGKNEQCDRPLDIYLIVFLVRLGFSLPLLVYQHLRPLHSDGDNINSTATMAAATVAAATARTSRTAPTPTPTPTVATATAVTTTTTISPSPRSNTSISSSLTNTPATTRPSSPLSNNNNTSTPTIPQVTTTSPSHPTDTNTNTNTNTHAQSPSSSSRPTIPTRSCLDRIKSFLDLISILWFVVGNYLIFTASDQCHREANHLFYTTLAWILLGYFLVLIPLLLCATVVFCLPCLLVTMRTMNVDYATGMVGANKDEIQAIPVYKYKSSNITSIDDAPEQQQQQQAQHDQQPQQPQQESTSSPNVTSVPLPASTSTSTSPDSSTTTPKKKKKSLLTRIFFIPSHNKNPLHEEETATGYAECIMDDPSDTSCTICLSDYEDGDLVCKLRCNHHFHRDCVHEWLALNFKCPLCQRDFRSEKTENDDDHSH